MISGCPSGILGVRPEIRGASEGGEGRDEITVSFELMDEDLTRAGVRVEYSAGGAWLPASIADALADGAPCSLAGSSLVGMRFGARWVACSFAWDSWADRVGEAGATDVTLRLTPYDADGVGVAVELALTVNNHHPTLEVAETAVAFQEGVAGLADPPAVQINISNTGAAGTTLAWQITGAPAWLALSATSGATLAGEKAIVSVSAEVVAQGLAAGDYSATLTIDAGADARGSPVSLPVTLAVRDPAPEIAIRDGAGGTLAHLYFQIAEGEGNPPSQSFFVENSGDATTVLAWTAADDVSSPDWLSYVPAAADTAQGASTEVAVSVDATILGAGTYQATIAVTGSEKTTGEPALSGDKTVTVHLTIGTAAEIVLSPASFTFSAQEGGADPATQTLSISNPGDAALNWSVADDAAWLTLSPLSGEATTETDLVTLTVSIAGLSAGTHAATITVSAPGATNTPQTAAVTLTVAGQPVPQGLVAWWKLDETSGTKAADSSGSGNDGTVYGATWQPTGGKIGGALSFDGSDDYVDIGVKPVLTFAPGQEFTVAGWFRTVDGWGAILSLRSSTDETPVVNVTVGFNGRYADSDGGKLQLVVRSAQMAKVRGGAVDDGAWHHFAAVRRFNGNVELYVDALSEGASNDGGAAIATDLRSIGVDRRWILDSFATQDERFLQASIDDVRIYDRALSGSEIQTLYESGLTPMAPEFTSTPPTEAGVGVTYSYTIEASGYPAPTFGVTGLPTWLTFDGTDAISGTPTAGDVGVTGTITVTAANGVSPDDTQQFTITVTDDPLLQGLVAHWKLDETSGTTASDSSGNGNDGTLVGGPVWQPMGGKIGGSLRFDGTNDFVRIGDVLDMGLSDWSVGVWMKTDILHFSRLVSKNNHGGADGWFLSTVAIAAGATVDGLTMGLEKVFQPYAFPYADGAWHQVVGVWDRDGNGSIYVDGVLLGAFDISSKAAANVQTSFVTCIGCRDNGASAFFNGLLDDVRIYSRALSAAEIGALAAMGE
jgi:hypothetical protein